MVCAGGHSLRGLLDYDDGVTPDEFFDLYRGVVKFQAERKKQEVENFAVALGGLFDGKILKKFNDTMDKFIKRIDGESRAAKHGGDQSLGSMTHQEQRAAKAQSAKNLNQLTQFFSMGPGAYFDGWGEGD
jgi:hypothetical protein